MEFSIKIDKELLDKRQELISVAEKLAKDEDAEVKSVVSFGYGSICVFVVNQYGFEVKMEFSSEILSFTNEAKITFSSISKVEDIDGFLKASTATLESAKKVFSHKDEFIELAKKYTELDKEIVIDYDTKRSEAIKQAKAIAEQELLDSRYVEVESFNQLDGKGIVHLASVFISFDNKLSIHESVLECRGDKKNVYYFNDKRISKEKLIGRFSEKRFFIKPL